MKTTNETKRFELMAMLGKVHGMLNDLHSDAYDIGAGFAASKMSDAQGEIMRALCSLTK
jgi:hypothetical protein